MNYRITGLDPAPFQHLFGLPDEELSRHGARRYTANADSGFPDRIEMRDARPGETLILLNHTSQDADSPYYARHAIFVREGATERFDAINTIPAVMKTRLLSIRGFSEEHMIIDADVAEGKDAEACIKRLFDNPDIAYLHVHNAKQGCFSGLVERA